MARPIRVAPGRGRRVARKCGARQTSQECSDLPHRRWCAVRRRALPSVVRRLVDHPEHELSRQLLRQCCQQERVATVKKELVYCQEYQTQEKARTSLFEYMEVFYHRERLHSTIGYVSPVEHEQAWNEQHQAPQELLCAGPLSDSERGPRAQQWSRRL